MATIADTEEAASDAVASASSGISSSGDGSTPIARLGVDRNGDIVYAPGLAGLPEVCGAFASHF